jgi:hypothetical protein
MKQEIIDFFAGHNIEMSKMINIGVNRHGLTAEAVKRAAEDIHQRIQSGEDIRPIRLAWEVFAKAKTLNVSAAKKEADKEKKIKELKAEIAELKTPFWKKLIRRFK